MTTALESGETSQDEKIQGSVETTQSLGEQPFESTD